MLTVVCQIKKNMKIRAVLSSISGIEETGPKRMEEWSNGRMKRPTNQPTNQPPIFWANLARYTDLKYWNEIPEMAVPFAPHPELFGRMESALCSTAVCYLQSTGLQHSSPLGLTQHST